MHFEIKKDDELTYTAILECPGFMRIHFSTEHLQVLRELVVMLEQMYLYEQETIARMQAEEERSRLPAYLRYADEF
jgi:hypothetical protein